MKFKPFQFIIPTQKNADHFTIQNPNESGKEDLNLNNFSSIINNVSPLKKLDELISNQTLNINAIPCFFFYKQSSATGVFQGIIGLTSVQDFINKTILPHENILDVRSSKMAEYLIKTPIHAEPINIIAEELNLEEIEQNATKQNPLLEFTKHGVLHQLWKIVTVDEISTKVSKIESALIADGHHRMDATLNYYSHNSNRSPFVNTFLTNTKHIKICPFHREIEITQMEKKRILRFIQERKFNSIVALPRKLNEDQVIFQIDGQFYIRHVPLFENENVYTLLNEKLFDPILNIHNIRKSNRIQFIPGERDILSLSKMPLANNRMRIFMPALSFQTIIELSKKGIMLPPKSTWILPKLLTGLTIYDLREHESL